MAERISILCGTGGNPTFTRECARDIEQKYGIQIDFEIARKKELISELSKNPNYNFVIIHVGHERGDAYVAATRCRELSSAVLVGESSMHPLAYEEVKTYFNEYVGLINDSDLEYILRKYGFIR